MLRRVWTGSCWVAASFVAAAAGGGSLGCGGWGVPVWIRVWVRAVSLGLQLLLLWCWRLCGVVVVVLLLLVESFGRRLGYGVGLGVRSGSRLWRTSVWRCEGAGAGWGGFPVCCLGAWVACVGVGGPLVAWRAAAALALAVALLVGSAGSGGSEDEVEDVDEDEDEEEVVVLGDAGCAVMRAVAGLWAAAPAAATAGRMEGMFSGCRFWFGGWGGPAVTWRRGWPIWSAAVGEGVAGLPSSPSGLG